MKKKSLLILPVLLLALAACNKEEEVEEPEDNTPEVTEPGDDTGEDDGTQNPPAVTIDERIELAQGTRSFTGAESVTYENGEGLSISDPVLVDGAITYYVSGTPNYMDYTQATTFGGANVGDAYIILAIKLEEGETLHTSKDIPYSDTDNGVEDVIIGISGSGKGYKEYTVTTGEGEDVETVASYVIDYKGVISIDRRVSLATESVCFDGSNVPFTNPDTLYIDSISMDSDGNVTYVLGGTPDVMSHCQEEAFQVEGAEGSAYVVLTITLESDETVSFNGKLASATEDVIVRLVNYTDLVFTITAGESGTVTHTVVFSGLTHPSTGDNGGDTGNDEP